MALAGPLGAAAGGLLVANQVLNNLNVGVNNNGDVVIRHNNVDAEVNLGNPVAHARRVGRYFLGNGDEGNGVLPDNPLAMDVVDQQVNNQQITPYRGPRNHERDVDNSVNTVPKARLRGTQRLRRRWHRKFFDQVSNKKRKWRSTRRGARGTPWR